VTPSVITVAGTETICFTGSLFIIVDVEIKFSFIELSVVLALSDS
jgi:hypothetical protein